MELDKQVEETILNIFKEIEKLPDSTNFDKCNIPFSIYIW